MQPGFEGDQLPEAAYQLEAFFETRNLDEKIEYLRRHSFLLTAEPLGYLDGIEKKALEEGDKESAEYVASHRLIIKTIQEYGFSEGAKRLHELSLIQTVKDFMDGYSWWDSYVYLQRHPELLSEDAQGYLLAFGKRAHDQGDKQAEKVAITHYNLVRRVAEVGAEAAFTEVGGTDFTNALHRRSR